MPEDMILEEARQRVARYWRVVLTLVVPAFLAMVAGLFSLGTSSRAAGSAFLLMAGLVALTVVQARKVVTSSPVLWIRRFGQGESSRRLHAHLQVAVLGAGNLITLGDDDVLAEPAWPDAVAALVAVVAFHALGMPLVVGVIGAAYWIGDRRLKNHRKRTRFLTGEKLLRKLGRALRATRRSQGAESVFLCHGDEETWRQAIDFLAERVDAVVVSVDESSGPMREEIRRLLAAGRVTPRNIVLLQTDPSSTGLTGQFPALADAWTFSIPTKLGWWPLNRTGWALAVTIKAAVLSRDPAVPGAATAANGGPR